MEEAPPPRVATRDALACSGEAVIQPAGAVFCYRVPEGFSDVTAQLTTEVTVGSTGPAHRSGVAVGPDDVISVSDGPIAMNSDLVGDEELIALVGPLVAQGQQQGATFTSTVPEKIVVDGARAFRLHGTFGKATHTIIMVFRGGAEVAITCQFTEHEAKITRGCDEVLSSMQIRTQA